MKLSTRLFMITSLTCIMYLLPFESNDLFAQRRGNRICTVQNNLNNCQSIPGITTKQKQKISELKESHQQEMELLRQEKRNTRSDEQKNAIDKKMTTKLSNHKNDVKAILTPEQQKYYDENCSKTNRMQRSKGKRNGRGQGNGQGKGVCRFNR